MQPYLQQAMITYHYIMIWMEAEKTWSLWASWNAWFHRENSEAIWRTLPLIAYTTRSARPVSRHGGKKKVSAIHSRTARVATTENQWGMWRWYRFSTFLPNASNARKGICIVKKVSHFHWCVWVPIIYLNRTAHIVDESSLSYIHTLSSPGTKYRWARGLMAHCSSSLVLDRKGQILWCTPSAKNLEHQHQQWAWCTHQYMSSCIRPLTTKHADIPTKRRLREPDAGAFGVLTHCPAAV